MATNPLIHYALDLETPPVIACETHVLGIIYSPTASEVTCPDCRATEHFPQRQSTPAATPTITAGRVLMAASVLINDGIGPEYDRAIVDLTCDLIGAGPDDTVLMTRILRALKQGEM